jgi:hypothetical protein
MASARYEALISGATDGMLAGWALSALPPSPASLAGLEALRTPHAPCPVVYSGGPPAVVGGAVAAATLSLVFVQPREGLALPPVAGVAVVRPTPDGLVLFAGALPAPLSTGPGGADVRVRLDLAYTAAGE